MRTVNNSIFISLLLVAAEVIAFYVYPPSDFSMRIMGILGMLQLFTSVYTWSRVTGTTITPYVVFIIAAYVFTFGQSILYVFGKVSAELDLTKMFASTEIYPAQMLTLVFLGFFHMGALWSCRNRESFECPMLEYVQHPNVERQILGVKKVGTFLLLFSTIPYIIERSTIYVISATAGYSSLYEQDVKIGIFNIVNILSQYFIPGILCKLLVEKKKSMRNIYIAIMLFEIIFWMYVGGRSAGVIVAAILLLYYRTRVQRVKWKTVAIISVVGYFFVSLLAVISETRNSVGSNLLESASGNLGQGAAFYSAISEMGGSMYPMITSMELVPNRFNYMEGSSYLYSLTSVIPNLGFWDLHPAMRYGNLNQWLQDALNLNYGPGFSIVAEAYVNFGYFGFLLMLLLGYLLGRVLRIDAKTYKNPLLIVLAFIFCFLIIKTVRNSFLSTVRSIFYYLVPIYLIVTLYYKGKIVK